jgi:ribosome-associated protein
MIQHVNFLPESPVPVKEQAALGWVAARLFVSAHGFVTGSGWVGLSALRSRPVFSTSEAKHPPPIAARGTMKKKSTLPTTPSLPTEQKSQLMAASLYEKQGEDIVVLDVTGICPIAEHIIVVSARGQRHAQSLADAALHLAKEKNFVSFGMEGYDTGSWILVDLNDIIVHVFQEDLRKFYNIEGLWSEGKRLPVALGAGSEPSLEQ